MNFRNFYRLRFLPAVLKPGSKLLKMATILATPYVSETASISSSSFSWVQLSEDEIEPDEGPVRRTEKLTATEPKKRITTKRKQTTTSKHYPRC